MKNRLKHRWKVIRSYISWEDYIAVGLIYLGAIGYFQGPIPYVAHLSDFYMDIRSDLIGIGITVLIIDNVNEMYRRREEKRRLILQMGSPDHAFAIEAVRQLSVRKWLYDGSLEQANLGDANLHKADLSKADFNKAVLHGANLHEADLNDANLHMATLSLANLCEANLFGANLSMANLILANLHGANLRYANLRGANLMMANLSEAILYMVDLSEAKLHNVDLRGANLSDSNVTNDQLYSATLDKTTTMPDGSKYLPPTEEINLAN